MAKRIKRPRGRPPLPEHQRKGRILKFRARGDLVSRMQAAAQATGRSVSEEIEYRLEHSFSHERSEERDRELVQEAVAATLSKFGIAPSGEVWSWERRAEHAAKAAAEHERHTRESGVVNLMDALRRQVQAGEQSSAATNKETKKRTGTEDKS